MSRGKMCQGRYLRLSLHMLVKTDDLLIVVRQFMSFFDGQATEITSSIHRRVNSSVPYG
jgi:hypothetical protein